MSSIINLQMSGVILLFFGSILICSGEDIKPLKINQCKTIGKLSDKAKLRLIEIQEATEKGLLFSIPATTSGIKDCNFSGDLDSLELKYYFNDGGWLRVIVSDVIELDSEEGQFFLSKNDDPLIIMRKEARRVFGQDSCGIDWNNPEVKKDVNTIQTIYWGEICNCRVGIRRDLENRVIGLKISSVCN